MEQTQAGHAVGIVAAQDVGGPNADAALKALEQRLAFGVSQIPMGRHLAISDWRARNIVASRARELKLDVLHGHGAKGGAYVRLMSGASWARVYTPHGGSLHYSPTHPLGFAYLSLERVLLARTDALLAESAYAAETFQKKVGDPGDRLRVVHNGLGPAEFEPVRAAEGASDVLFVGELRRLKGVDVLISALIQLRQQGSAVRATIVGAGPDEAMFRAQAVQGGLGDTVRFAGPMPARQAFSLGRILVVPSRAESLPYIVLEAAAAALPIIATRVGGIPEIFGPDATRLIAPDDSAALGERISSLASTRSRAEQDAARLRERIRSEFSIDTMTKGVMAAYEAALARPRVF